MGSLPSAVSVHSFVTSVGNYAGFAALVGLAILVLLHFAQARETAGLREQAHESAQRIDELEAEVADLAQAQPASEAQPEPAPAVPARAGGRGVAPAPAPAGAAGWKAVPWAPAGVAAPALTAATRLIPLTAPAGAVSAPAGAPVGSPVAAAAVPAAAGPATAAAAVGSRSGITNGAARERVAAAPARVAGGGGARGPVSPAGGAGVRGPVRASTAEGARGPGGAATGRGAGAGTAVGAAQRVAARQAGGAPRFLPPEGERSGRSRTGRVIAVVLGLLLLAAAIVVVLVATSTIGGKSHATAASGAGTAHAGQSKRLTAFDPSGVTVAVLNGTGSPGLAGRTAQRLTADGYRKGTVATASDQTETTTAVAYLPGYRTDAEHVAAALKLPATDVQQVNSTEQAVACPPPARCSANVVVTVGADLASS